MKNFPNTQRHGAGRPMRLLMVAMFLSVAGGVLQTSHAAPGMHGDGGAGMHGDPSGPGGMGMGMAHPRHMDRLLDSINATAEQRAQVKQIVTAAQADMRAQHEQGRALRQQSQSLFTQPTVDARAAETLRQQMQAQHDQASKRKMQLMLDISRVLTPEQRKAMAERMNQRRAMMERHRAERDGLEKPVMK